MKGDLPLPALRLMQQLPVRTHEQREVKTSKQLAYYYAAKDRARKAMKPGVGRGMNQPQARAVIINGRHYESMKEACTQLHIGHTTFYAMIQDGRAVRCITQRS